MKIMASSMLLPILVAAAHAQTSSPTKFICDTGSSAVAYKATYTYQGCYSDPNSNILSDAKINTILVTPQYCATYCGGRGFAYGGLRTGNTCYCGATPNFDNVNKANDTQCSSKCPTDPSFTCGSYNSMSLYKIDNPKSSGGIEKSTARTPACYTSPLCSHQVCNTSLSISERVASLVNSLTEQEKIFNMVDASGGSERLGLPPYAWWNEATHGVGEAPGVQFNPMPGNFSYATSFPSPILSAAAFDDNLIFKIGQVVGKEARAFGNNGFSGWNFWAPNMNAFRDPRWGRGLETPGEDPLHVSNYVRAYVPGLQGDDLDHKQIIATCKHYAVYDIETGRRGNSYNPTQQDMADYYMVSFKACVRDAHVGSIMCSYNSVNGIPSCASEYLLQDVLRDHWNFTGPADYVVSDCGAPQAVFSWHNYTNSAADGAAVSLNAGTDLECGTSFLNLNISIAANTTSVARMDQALTRLYHALFNVGYFDSSPYQNLGWSDVGTPDAQQLAYQAAVEGIVLLKNDGILPAKNPRKVALIGPYANATVQMQGTYSGTAKDIVSPLRAAQNIANWEVTYAGGTAINTTNTTGFAPAVSAATQADLVIYLGGLDTSVEREALDRTTLTWPGNQLDLIEQLAKVSKSLVVVQFGGGQVDDAPLLKSSGVNGIVWAGYPSQDGGTAIMDIITGKVAPAGRLPVTQYPASYVNEVSIYDIELRPNDTYPGRTNRFYTGVPTLPFGYGLSYTTFEFTWRRALNPQYNVQSLIAEHRAVVKLSGTSGDVNDATSFASVEVEVSNTGKVTSDFVGLLFLSSQNAGPKPRPLKTLVSYARLHNIKVGTPQNMSLPLTLGSLARADVDGNLVIYPGDYTLFLDVNGNKSLSFNFTITGDQTGNVIETLPIPKSSYPATVPVHLQAPSRQAYGPNY